MKATSNHKKHQIGHEETIQPKRQCSSKDNIESASQPHKRSMTAMLQTHLARKMFLRSMVWKISQIAKQTDKEPPKKNGTSNSCNISLKSQFHVVKVANYIIKLYKHNTISIQSSKLQHCNKQDTCSSLDHHVNRIPKNISKKF